MSRLDGLLFSVERESSKGVRQGVKGGERVRKEEWGMSADRVKTKSLAVGQSLCIHFPIADFYCVCN